MTSTNPVLEVIIEAGFEPAGLAAGRLEWVNGCADGYAELPGDRVALAIVDDNTIVLCVSAVGGLEHTHARFVVDGVGSTGATMFLGAVQALSEIRA